MPKGMTNVLHLSEEKTLLKIWIQKNKNKSLKAHIYLANSKI